MYEVNIKSEISTKTTLKNVNMTLFSTVVIDLHVSLISVLDID